MNSHATTLLRDHRRRFGLSALVVSLLLILAIPSVVFAQTPPSAVGKNASTTEDTPVTIDTGIAVDALYEVKQTNAGPNSPAHGTVSAGPTVNGNYSINYTPGPNRVDAVSFDYHLCMTLPPNSCGAAATVNVTITPANDAPTADNDAATTAEDTPVNIDVLDGDSAGPADEDQSLTIVDLQNPTAQGGSAAIVNGQVNYTPPANFCGVDTFTYRAQDSGGLKSGAQPPLSPTFATGTVNVTCVNDKPVATADTFTVLEDSNPVSHPADNIFYVLANDNAGPNEAAQIPSLSIFDIPTPPTNGTAVINGNKIEYTPDANFCGTDSFEYRNEDDTSIDGTAKKDKGLVTVTVTCVVDKPKLSIENVSAVDDHMFTADVILTSPDKDVSGVNFDLDYVCLLTPVVQPNTTPPVPPFFVDIQDDGNKLGFLIGDQSGSGAVLAGPSASAQSTLAQVKFTIDSTSPCVNVNNNQASVTLDIQNEKFSGPNAALVAGDPSMDYPAANPLILNGANELPGATSLSPNTVPEKVPGAFVGFLSTVDPDVGDVHTYSIVNPNKCSPAAETNTLFQIISPPNTSIPYVKLQNGKSTDFAAKPVHRICVESTDNYGAKSYTNIVIDVVQGNLAPVAVDDGTPTPIVVKGPTLIDVLLNDIDPNGNNTIVVDSVTNSAHGIVINNGTNVTFVATDPNYLNLDTFSYTIKDDGGLTDSASVTVNINRDKAPGNCNGQGNLDAGDLTAWGLEFFDGDDNSKWYHTPNSIGGGTFDGSSYGCNSNKNSEIDAGDLTCIGILYFNGTCNPALLAASTSTMASLAVNSGLSAAPGATVAVPIMLTSAGNSVAAAAFAVDFDASVLSFDATDADGNGVPDAVSLNIPGGLFTMVNYNATESRVEIIVSGMAPPFPLLTDGALATVNLTVNADASSNESAILLTNSSLGNDEGMPVPLEVTDGTVQINVEGQSQMNFLYLPTVQR